MFAVYADGTEEVIEQNIDLKSYPQPELPSAIECTGTLVGLKLEAAAEPPVIINIPTRTVGETIEFEESPSLVQFYSDLISMWTNGEDNYIPDVYVYVQNQNCSYYFEGVRLVVFDNNAGLHFHFPEQSECLNIEMHPSHDEGGEAIIENTNV